MAVHFYSVYVRYYVSRKARAVAEAMPSYLRKPELYRLVVLYEGISKREMERALYKACRLATRRPLFYQISVWDNGKETVKFQPDR